MRPALNAVAARNGGVFLRRDAVRAGYSEREMKTLTGPRGDWVVVRRGCYAERTLWDVEDDEGRYRLRVLAAHLTTTRPAVLWPRPRPCSWTCRRGPAGVTSCTSPVPA